MGGAYQGLRLEKPANAAVTRDAAPKEPRPAAAAAAPAVFQRRPHRLANIASAPPVQRVLFESVGSRSRSVDSAAKVESWIEEKGLAAATNVKDIRDLLTACATQADGKYSLQFHGNTVRVEAFDSGESREIHAQFPPKTISGGSFHPGMRLQPDVPDYGLKLLQSAAMLDTAMSTVESKETSWMSSGMMSVLSEHPPRDSSEHRTAWADGTGHSSAGEHMGDFASSLVPFGEKFNATSHLADFEITHLVGHSVAGKIAQDVKNLVAASSGANTEMIAWESAVIALRKEYGADIEIQTDAVVLKKSQVALSITMTFYLNSQALHSEVIHALRPTPFAVEFESTKLRALKTLFDAASRMSGGPAKGGGGPAKS